MEANKNNEHRLHGNSNPLMDEVDDDSRRQYLEDSQNAAINEVLMGLNETLNGNRASDDIYEVALEPSNNVYQATPIEDLSRYGSPRQPLISQTPFVPEQLQHQSTNNGTGQVDTGATSFLQCLNKGENACEKPKAKCTKGKDLRLVRKQNAACDRKRTSPTKPTVSSKKPAIENPLNVTPKPVSTPTAPSKDESQSNNRLRVRSLSTARNVTFRANSDPGDAIGPNFHNDDDLPADVHAKLRVVVTSDYEVMPNHYARMVCQEVSVQKKGGCVDPMAKIRVKIERHHEMHCKP